LTAGAGLPLSDAEQIGKDMLYTCTCMYI
jgi:hypothetical protein